jgi:hypothetical protein
MLILWKSSPALGTMTTELSLPTRQIRPGSASSVFKPGGFSAWDVRLGAGHSTNIHLMGESGPSSVFSMRTKSGFSRYTSEHRASALDISQDKMERISPARHYHCM